MKYKHVFKIWLLADAFLAAGLLCFGFYSFFAGDGGLDDVLGMFLMISFYGVLVSLPSLAVLSIFHFLFQRFAIMPEKYTTAYITIIVMINILYLVIGRFSFQTGREFDIFYLGSTLAGLLSFYVINTRVKKKEVLLLQ